MRQIEKDLDQLAECFVDMSQEVKAQVRIFERFEFLAFLN